MHEPKIYYNYNPIRCRLDVKYNVVTNVVTVRGGKHGFSHLAELLSYYATASNEADHEHWDLLAKQKQRFEIAYVPLFSEEALANGDE